MANIIAQRSCRTLRRLNATTASLADIREVMDQVATLLAPNGVLLYLDEGLAGGYGPQAAGTYTLPSFHASSDDC